MKQIRSESSCLAARRFRSYPDDYNPIIEYWQKIESGEEVVSDKVRRTYRKLVHDIENPSEWFYSAKRANHILEFAENFCHHSKGKLGGQLVVLELWEKALLAAAFGFVNIEGVRKYQRVMLLVGKKNGKSLISSIVGLYLMVADQEAGPEIYAAATKKDQARIIWSEAKRMVAKSPHLRKKIRSHVADLEADFCDGIFKPVASDSDTLDGLNVHGALLDEIHQWKNGWALFNIIVDGTTARVQPMTFITTTAGTIREDIYDDLYDEGKRVINSYFSENGFVDERSLYLFYELDSRSEWTLPECWKKANPGLGTIKNERTLAEKVERAKVDEKQVKNLICKEFNIAETSTEAWLIWDVINNEEKFNVESLKPRYFIGGADLSSTTDLTAAKALFRVPGDSKIYVMSMYWIAEDLVEKKVKQDQIPYDIWIEQGLCRTCPGNRVHHHCVTEWFEELMREHDIYPLYIGYDSWSATYWVEEMQGVFGKVMLPVIQGKKTLSNPMQVLERELEAHNVIYNNNPIDKWCLANTYVDKDKNGNIQPVKSTKSTRRIDGTAALLDAFTIYLEKQSELESMM